MLPNFQKNPTSLPVPSLWVIPVHQPEASSIVHQTWTGDSFRDLPQNAVSWGDSFGWGGAAHWRLLCISVF